MNILKKRENRKFNRMIIGFCFQANSIDARRCSLDFGWFSISKCSAILLLFFSVLLLLVLLKWICHFHHFRHAHVIYCKFTVVKLFKLATMILHIFHSFSHELVRHLLFFLCLCVGRNKNPNQYKWPIRLLHSYCLYFTFSKPQNINDDFFVNVFLVCGIFVNWKILNFQFAWMLLVCCKLCAMLIVVLFEWMSETGRLLPVFFFFARLFDEFTQIDSVSEYQHRKSSKKRLQFRSLDVCYFIVSKSFKCIRIFNWKMFSWFRIFVILNFHMAQSFQMNRKKSDSWDRKRRQSH